MKVTFPGNYINSKALHVGYKVGKKINTSENKSKIKCILSL